MRVVVIYQMVDSADEVAVKTTAKPANETVSKGQTGIEYNVSKYIGVNIGSITVGAICFMAATAWIDFFRDITDETYLNYYDRYRDRYRSSRRSLLTAVLFTIIAIFSTIIMYSWHNHSKLEVECGDKKSTDGTGLEADTKPNDKVKRTTNAGVLFSLEELGEVVTTTDASPDGRRFN